MKNLTFVIIINLFSFSVFAETIVCDKNFTMSSAVGIKKGFNGTDMYNYSDGILQEIFDGKAIWTYSHVTEKNGFGSHFEAK